MKSPLVSIIIPTHNRPELLLRAVQSAVNQTYQNTEIIVVDDIGNVPIENLKKISDKIQYIQIPETFWMSKNRNAGILIAQGKYIAWLDDDDIWFDNYLNDLIPIMESDESIGLACSNGYMINKLTETPTRLIFPHLHKEMKGRLFIQTIWDCFTLPSLMITRKNIFDVVGVYRDIRGEDLDIIMRISAYANMYYTPKLYGTWFRKLNNGSASEYMQSTLCNRLEILIPIIQCLTEIQNESKIKLLLSEKLTLYFQIYFYNCYIIAIHFMFKSEKRYKILKYGILKYPLLSFITLLAPLCLNKTVRDFGQKIKRELI